VERGLKWGQDGERMEGQRKPIKQLDWQISFLNSK